MNVLVDTSAWSLALRRSREQLSEAEQVLVAELKELIQEGRARLIGLIRQELLSGIRTPSQFEKLRALLRSFPDEPIHTLDHEAAAEAGNQCRRRGIAVSAVDALICAIAMRRQWSLFSTDPDFETMARVVPLRLHVPRGER